MSRARITYRFDQEGNRLPKRPEVKDEPDGAPRDAAKVIPLFQGEYPNDYGAWTSPIDMEIARLEQLIRGTEEPEGREQAAVEPYEREDLRVVDDGSAERLDQSRHREPDRPAAGGGQPFSEQSQWGIASGGQEEELGFQSQPGYTRREPIPVYDEHLVSSHFRRHTRTPWLKIMASVIGAVATGLIFGFFVLSMFSDANLPDDPLQADAQGALTDATNDSADQQAASDGQADLGADASESTTTPSTGAQSGDDLATSGWLDVGVQGYTFYILQSGVYSTVEMADAAIADLQQSGLAAASFFDGKYYVYAGIASNRDDASELGVRLNEQKMETYIKPFTIPAIQKVTWGAAQSDTIGNFFTSGNQLAQLISGVTMAHLSAGTLTALDDNTIKALNDEHRGWSGLSNSVLSTVDKAGESSLQAMNTAMNTAVASLNEYSKRLSEAHLWQAQSALLDYVLAERQLLSAVAITAQ